MASRISVVTSKSFRQCCVLRHISQAGLAAAVLEAFAEDAKVREAVSTWQAKLEPRRPTPSAPIDASASAYPPPSYAAMSVPNRLPLTPAEQQTLAHWRATQKTPEELAQMTPEEQAKYRRMNIRPRGWDWAE